MEVKNPFDQSIVGTIDLLESNQVEGVIQRSNQSLKALELMSSGDRCNVLKDIVSGLESRFEEMVETISKESGKPRKYATAEVNRAIQTFTIASEESKRLPHELIDLDSTEKGRGLKGEVIYKPRGVVFGISPFNFPLNLAVHKIAPAIASGCPIILKPSSKTPLAMELLAEIISETELPENAFQLVHCSREVGNEFVEHDDVHVLSFTGSPGVGWSMKSKAGKKEVVLELGGNAAAIICKDADLELALKELVVGGFAYSGQVCIHTQRIYLHNSVFDNFVNKYVEATNDLKIGDPLESDTEFGVMIDEDNAKRVESWVKEAMDNGAELITGHKREGSLYSPTLLTKVPRGQKVRDEEVFGPVVVIESFDNFNEAIQEVNDCRWGLQAAIFTDSIKWRDQAFQKLNVGAVIHNKSTTFRVDDMPYGGIKDSGFGREGIRYAMRDYLEPKLLVR